MTSNYMLMTCVWMTMTSLAVQVSPTLDSFDQLVSQLMDCRQVPGLVVTVVDMRRDPYLSGPLVLQRQYGWADVEARRRMTANTRVCVASLTKAFTSALLGILMQNTSTGTAAWDTPLSQLLPADMATFDDGWVTNRVTLRDILLHRTGVSRSYDELWVTKALDRQHIVRLIKHMEASSNFRAQAIYNNIIYSLAGHVIERLSSGKSWESVLREVVLGPLNMTQTSFYYERDDPTRFALPYLYPNGIMSPWQPPPSLSRGVWSVGSAAAVCSTQYDMSQWITALLNSVSYSGSDCDGPNCPLLPPSIIRETFRPQVLASHMIRQEIRRPRTDVPFYIDGYGLGWFTGHYRGWNTVLHYGSFIGAYSLLTLLPELRMGVFTSYNGASQIDPYTLNSLLHIHLVDLFTGVKPSVNNATDWCRIIGGEGHHHRQSADRTESPPRDYGRSVFTGIYRHAVLGEFEVVDDRSQMTATFGSITMRLRPLDSDVEFSATPTDPAWEMLFGEIHVRFEAPDGGKRCRSVNVSLFQYTTFQRDDEQRNSAAVSAVITPRACPAGALPFIVTTLLLHERRQ